MRQIVTCREVAQCNAEPEQQVDRRSKERTAACERYKRKAIKRDIPVSF